MFHVGAVTIFFSNAMFLFDCLRLAHFCSLLRFFVFFGGSQFQQALFLAHFVYVPRHR